MINGRATRERKFAVCAGSAGLTPAERAELLTMLAEDSHDLVREKAGNALLTQEAVDFVGALQGDAPAATLFRYCGRSLIEQPEIAAAMLKHRQCPQEYLVAAAKRVPTNIVQELLEDLDRLSIAPALVGALLHSASLTADQRQQLQELLRETTEKEESFAESAADAEPDITKRASLLQRLSKMRVVERVQLALKGNREERIALIRDPCKVVQRAVLQSPRITDREVESFSAMANLNEEVLRIIAGSRKFRRNYSVTRNLVTNPKTPLDISLRLLPNLTATDLKTLLMNKNIPETLRTTAYRLNRQRHETRSGE
jgi:hypothetical protein